MHICLLSKPHFHHLPLEKGDPHWPVWNPYGRQYHDEDRRIINVATVTATDDLSESFVTLSLF